MDHSPAFWDKTVSSGKPDSFPDSTLTFISYVTLEITQLLGASVSSSLKQG